MSDIAITNGKIGSISDTITLKDIPRRPTIYENAHGTGLAYCSAPDTTRYADAMERRIAKSEARVIALERALREIIDMPHGETICCDMEAIAYAALNGESK